MGFFSKVFKGVGKVFRKIGRGLKKVVAKIGKFMGKIGIVGQIALGLLLPGVGSMLSGMLGSVGGALAGSSNILLRGAGQFIEKAISLGTQVGKTFSTVTEGVTKVIGETVGAVVNKIPGAGDLLKNISGGRINITDNNWSSVWDTAQTAVKDSIAAGKDIFSSLSSAGSIPTSADVAAEYDYTKKDQAPITEEQVADYTKEWDIKQNVSKVANENTILKPQPSLLDNIVEGIKEIPDKVIDAGKEFFTDIPGKTAEAATSGFQSGVKSKVLNELGVETRPVQNITSVSGYVPTIDMSGTSDIGIASAQFNPIDYMANNSESMSLRPFGYNASIYNYANQYKGAMSQYGYAV
jgi:hypothetical protein